MNGGSGKVVINLATGLEDAERVTVAFLVAGAALEQGKSVAMFLTKEAIRLALPGEAEDLGVKATLTKPFDMGMLLAMVDRLTRPVRAD